MKQLAYGSLFFGALYSRHHDCGFKVSCTLFMYTSTLKPLPACLLSKAFACLFIWGVSQNFPHLNTRREGTNSWMEATLLLGRLSSRHHDCGDSLFKLIRSLVT